MRSSSVDPRLSSLVSSHRSVSGPYPGCVRIHSLKRNPLFRTTPPSHPLCLRTPFEDRVRSSPSTSGVGSSCPSSPVPTQPDHDVSRSPQLHRGGIPSFCYGPSRPVPSPPTGTDFRSLGTKENPLPKVSCGTVDHPVCYLRRPSASLVPYHSPYLSRGGGHFDLTCPMSRPHSTPGGLSRFTASVIDGVSRHLHLDPRPHTPDYRRRQLRCRQGLDT